MVDLRSMREAAGLSQERLASKIGVSSACLCRYEKGLRTPSVPTAQKIASVLGFDWTEFFEKEESA